MAFLTMIAPLVGLTYPIDKLKDGKAQAFNMWFKEYTFNLFIQPIDLILYIILIQSAVSLAETNFLYAIVAIGFLLQAEKFIKKMFGLGAEGGAGKRNFSSGAAFATVLGAVQNLSGGVTEAVSSAGEDPEKQKNTKVREADLDAPEDLSVFLDGPEKQQNKPKELEKNKKTLWEKMFNKNGEKTVPKLQNPESTPQEPPKKRKPLLDRYDQPRRKLHPIRGVKNVAKRYVNGKSGQTAMKLAAMGLGATAFGMVGLSAGFASDNEGDIWKMGVAGVAGGAFLGNQAVKQGKIAIGKGKKVIKTYQKGYYGKKYRGETINSKLDKKWIKDPDVRERFETLFGETYKDKLGKDWKTDALELRKQGLSDSEIERAMKLKLDNPGLTIEQAGRAVNFANNVTSREEFMKDGGEDQVRGMIEKQIGINNPEAVERAMQAVKQVLKLDTTGKKIEKDSDPEPGGEPENND